MDTHEFHAWATRRTVPAPQIAASALTNMSDAALSDHLDRVAQWVAPLYVEVDRFRPARDMLDQVTAFNQISLPGAKTIAAISGDNGAGKSTLCHDWAAGFYRRQVAQFPNERGLHRWQPAPGQTADVAPVVWINLQASAKVAELDSQILRFLRLGVSGSIRDLTLRSVRALAQHRVRVLLIDDVHLLNLSRNGGRDVLDHLKHLNTELGEQGGTMVMVGANLEQTGLVRDPQIAARLRVARFDIIDIRDAVGRQEWSAMVNRVEAALLPGLPAATSGGLEPLARLLYDLTGGHAGELVNLLKEALLLATITRAGTITAELLAQCARSYRATGLR